MDTDANFKKPIRARKTMTPSSRKQVENLKNLHGLGRPGNGTYNVDDYVQLKMIETECISYTPSKEPNPDPGSKETSAKEPLDKLVVNSEAGIYNKSPDVSRGPPYNGCNGDTGVKQLLSPESLRDLLSTIYKKEPSPPVSASMEDHLYAKPSHQDLDCQEEPTPSLSSVARETPTLNETEKVEEMVRNPAMDVLKQLRDNFQFREDDSLRERRSYGRKQETRCKCITTPSETGAAPPAQSHKTQSGLEKVRGFIQSQVDHSIGDLDRKVQQLNERIDRTQCLRKHEGITIWIIKKISRLHRHVNSVIDHQRAQLSKQVNLPDAPPRTTILNVAGRPSTSRNDPSVPLKRRSVQPGDVPSKNARSSSKEMCLIVESSGTQARNPTESQQKRASSSAQASVEAPEVSPKTKELIDLTEEEDTNQGKEGAASVKANPPPESTASKPSQTEPPKKEIPVRFLHLPPLPKIQLSPPHANGFNGTLPPQKLELDVALIQNPKGFALQWDIREADPRCAPIESFHLFIYLESEAKGAPSTWIKTNKIKASPLPMACSVSQFASSGKCYFAMQSEDIFGRFGPFCDIQSISAV